MAKTLKERVQDKLIREFYDGFWRFRGTEMFHVGRVGTNVADVCVNFSCGFMWVKARVSGAEYGMEDKVKMFVGQSAADECIAWTAEQVLAICEAVESRVRPFVQAHADYIKALRGGRA